MQKLVCFGVVLCCSALIAQNSSVPLDDQRIVDLVGMGVSQAEILRIIATTPKFSFDLRPVSTDAMMKAGVSEDTIKAMAARQNGVTGPSIDAGGKLKVLGTASPSVASVPPSQVPAQPSIASPHLVVNHVSSPVLTLYQGTPVRIRMMRTVSSADAQVGNNVDFRTLDDIRQNGVLVIPKGSTAIATITVAESKKRMARGGKLGMNIDYVRLPSGEELPLRGIQNLKGGGHTGAMTGAMVATAIVFWPASPFFLFMHGKDVVIPEGHEVTVYTNTDFQFSSN